MNWIVVNESCQKYMESTTHNRFLQVESDLAAILDVDFQFQLRLGKSYDE